MNKEEKFMSEQAKNVTNKVFVRGRLVGFGTDYLGRREMYIAIRGQYQERPINAAFTYRPNELDPSIRREDYLDIEATINGSNRTSRTTGERFHTQYFVADSIKPAKTEIQEVFGYNGGFSYNRPQFRAYYEGEVVEVVKTKGFVTNTNNRRIEVTYYNLYVKVPSEVPGRAYEIILAQYTSRMRVSDNELFPGDKVAIVANLVTKRKTGRNGEPYMASNLIVDDLFIVSRNTNTPVEPVGNGDANSTEPDANKVQEETEQSADGVAKEESSEEEQKSTKGLKATNESDKKETPVNGDEFFEETSEKDEVEETKKEVKIEMTEEEEETPEGEFASGNDLF